MIERMLVCLTALTLLLLLAPVILALALLIRWKLGSPVLFRQIRPGYKGHPFNLYKFRTMTDERDAQGRLLPDEQRLARFGALLRNTSLDELPQLFSVLKGDMNFVGPRPLLMEYLPLYSAEQARRHDVKPGITGWAKVNGRNTLNWQERFELDVWYVDNQSFVLDMRIIWLTLLRVTRRDGVSARGHVTMPKFTGNIGLEHK